MSAVLDASVLVAAVSPNERHHEEALALFESQPEERPYLVPALFRVEVVAAFARRGESDDLLELVDALVRGPRFHAFPVDDLLDEATRIARVAGLRAYDSLYAALANLHDVELMTLDEDVAKRLGRHVPQIRVRRAVTAP